MQESQLKRFVGAQALNHSLLYWLFQSALKVSLGTLGIEAVMVLTVFL